MFPHGWINSHTQDFSFVLMIPILRIKSNIPSVLVKVVSCKVGILLR